MNLSKLFKDFFKSESSGGIILISITVLVLISVNFIFHEKYLAFWKIDMIGKPIDFWINDVLMTVFFLLVGFEIEREFYIGELANIKKALLPIFAAIGGLIVPAVIYISLNLNSGSISGFGIPIATDIAFSLTVLTIVASRIPPALKVFLTALAIIDDICAIIIIAIFYSNNFSILYFSIALIILIMLFVFNRRKIKNLFLYFIPGIFLWICLYKSGIHPTITGVLLALLIPFGNGDDKSPSYRIQHNLHKPVAYFVLPLFAMANAGVLIRSSDFIHLLSTNSLGIFFGLVIGKPLGITLFCWAAIKLRFCTLFENLKMKHIFGSGLVAGIGFTMSIFITLLAFENSELIKISKLSIIIASFVSAVFGILFITFSNKKISKVMETHKD